MRKLIATALLALLATPALAQTNWNQTQMGNYTYYNGTMNGQPFNGTQTQMGNYTYGTFNNGGRTTNCTSTTMGSYRYTNCY
jgi:hypothetical protein